MESRGILHRSNQAGFTVHEILVATTLALATASTFLAFNRFQLFALRSQATQLNIQTAARSIMDLVAREVRRAGMNPTCANTFSAIADAENHELRIQSDLNGSGAIDGPDEDITYRFSFTHGVITRTAGGTSDVLLSGLDLSGSRFRYFDAAGNELIPAHSLSSAQRSMVRRVRLELALEGSAADPTTSGPLQARASTDVDVRNRFFVTSTACP